MKLCTTPPEGLHEETPPEWSILDTANWLMSIQGIGGKKAAEVASHAKDLGEFVELVETGGAKDLFGVVAYERVKSKLAVMGIKSEPRAKRARRNNGANSAVSFWLGKQGFDAVENAISFDACGVKWQLDMVAILDGQRTGMVVKPRLNRSALNEALMTCVLAGGLGLADRFILVSFNGNACVSSLPGNAPCKLVFLQE